MSSSGATNSTATFGVAAPAELNDSMTIESSSDDYMSVVDASVKKQRSGSQGVRTGKSLDKPDGARGGWWGRTRGRVRGPYSSTGE